MTADEHGTKPHDTRPSGSQQSMAAPPATRRPLLKFLAIGALLFVLFVLAAPSLFSAWMGAQALEDALRAGLDTDVTVEEASFGWFSGIHAEGIRIENPESFSRAEPAIELGSLSGDISFLSMIRRKFSMHGAASGLVVRVVQNEDGSINLAEFGGISRQVGSGGSNWPEGSNRAPTREEIFADTGQLDSVRLDIKLENSTLEISRAATGTIERLSNVRARLSKEFGTRDFLIEVDADLGQGIADSKPGHVTAKLDVDMSFQRAAVANLDCKSLDLARYRPLVAAFLQQPNDLEALTGVANGKLEVTIDPDREILLDGTLTVEEPRVAGAVVGGMDLRAPRWTLTPKLTIDAKRKPARVDASAFRLDLGFAQASGLDPAATTALVGDGLAASFVVDVQKLIGFGGALPDGLTTKGTRLTGKAGIAVASNNLDFETTSDAIRAIGLEARLEVPELSWEGRALRNLVATTTVKDGAFAIESADGAQLDGGSLSFTARGRADDLEGEPVNVSLKLDTAQVGGVGAGDAVRALRFAVPLLAGIAPDAAQVDFQSVVTMEVSAKGPAMPADEQDVATWIEQWSGRGRVALRTGSFTPSTEISRLLEMAGQSGKFAFDDLSTSFALDAGALATEAMQLEYQGRKIGLRGRTTIRGALDYQLDVASLLRGHRDGDKILEYIDPATLTAGLTGTLDAPSLTIPSFEALLQSAAQKALEKEASKQIDPLKQKAEEELQRALRRIFGR